MILSLLLACADPEPPLACPDKAEVVEIVPVAGGRAVWCARKDGSRNGPAREYRADGTLWKTGTYLGVRKEGQFTWYHPDGVTRAEQSTWAKNKLHGERIRWDEQGSELGREVWETGERISGDAGALPAR